MFNKKYKKVGIAVLYMLLSVCRGSSKEKEQIFRGACYDGDWKAVQNALKDEDLNINAADTRGYTGFHWACERGRKEVLKLLLADSRIKVTAKTKHGNTGFNWGCFLANKEVL